jgi:hypothetical protein
MYFRPPTEVKVISSSEVNVERTSSVTFFRAPGFVSRR